MESQNPAYSSPLADQFIASSGLWASVPRGDLSEGPGIAYIGGDPATIVGQHEPVFLQFPTRQQLFDRRGCDFDNVEEAYLAAFRAAQDMWRDLLVARKDPLLCAFEITDDSGRELVVLPFGEILDSCRGTKTVSAVNSHNGTYHEVLAANRRARNLISEISAALTNARASLRETVGLLSQVSKIERN